VLDEYAVELRREILFDELTELLRIFEEFRGVLTIEATPVACVTDQFHEDDPGQGFVLVKDHEYQGCYEAHALGVTNFWVIDGIDFQDIKELILSRRGLLREKFH